MPNNPPLNLTDLPALRQELARVEKQAESLMATTTRIGEFLDWETSGKVEEAVYRLRAYAALLRQVLEQGDGWISVSERLPEEGEGVQCLLSNGRQMVLYPRKADRAEFEVELEVRLANTRHVFTDAVTHWQPLPPPPACALSLTECDAQAHSFRGGSGQVSVRN